MTAVTFPGESEAYRQQREALLAAETALRDQREKVAALRRSLPLGPAVETDYVFREGPADLADEDPSRFFDTPLSSLFEGERNSLIVAHVMFSPEAERACPMCSLFVDGYDAVVKHLAHKAGFVAVAKAELGKFRRYAGTRGWHNTRLLSSHDNSFNRDFNVEVDEGQLPALSVFTKEPDGRIHHRYTTEGSLVFEHHRMMDLFCPVWHFFDLLPEGRGDWMPGHG